MSESNIEKASDESDDARLNCFQKDLAGLINKHCLESIGNIPDYLLAECLVQSLKVASRLVKQQNRWINVPK